MKNLPEMIPTAIAMLLGLAACTSPENGASTVAVATGRPFARDTALPSQWLTVAAGGNEARYRVREQLVGVDLPNDAVGRTSDITGAIALDPGGDVIPGLSRVVVDVTRLRSDRERRDGYVSGRLLETGQHPTVELVPTALEGLTPALPTSGTHSFELQGDLTVHGVTRPTNWLVEAAFEADRVTGTASTRFAFADFDLTEPRVPVVLGVADTIQLEVDFSLLRQSVAS